MRNDRLSGKQVGSQVSSQFAQQLAMIKSICISIALVSGTQRVKKLKCQGLKVSEIHVPYSLSIWILLVCLGIDRLKRKFR